MQINELEYNDRARCFELGYIGVVDRASDLSQPNVLPGYKSSDTSMTVFRHHWFGLYNILTYQEANALFKHMKTIVCKKDQQIIGSTDFSTGLCFLNKGNVRVYFKQDGCISDKQILTPGSLMGVETFFSDFVGNTSVVAMEDVEFDYLERHDLVNLEVDYPGLEMKLQQFCGLNETNVMERKEPVEERRKFPRIKTSGSVSGQLFDSSGASLELPVQGTLIDISKGGFSFHMLPVEGVEYIGKEMSAVLDIQMNNKKHDIAWGGTITAVNNDGKRMSVHVVGNDM